MKQTELYAGRHDGIYRHFYPSRTVVEFCGSKDVTKVLVRELQEGEASRYWAWWDGDFSMVYPSKVQFGMCFPYGAKVEEAKGNGKEMNVYVEEL